MPTSSKAWATNHQKSCWQACPTCGTDLREKNTARKPQYLEMCPFCRAPMQLAWWQRALIAFLGLILTFAIPAFLGFGKGIMLVFPAALFCFPAMMLAQSVVLSLVPPRYVRKQVFTTLFQQ